MLIPMKQHHSAIETDEAKGWIEGVCLGSTVFDYVIQKATNFGGQIVSNRWANQKVANLGALMVSRLRTPLNYCLEMNQLKCLVSI